MPIHHFADVPNPPDVDVDRAYELSEALERSLSSIAVKRLQEAAVVAQVAAARKPRALMEVFEFAALQGFPQTLLRHCTKLSRDDLSLEEKLIVMQSIDQDKLNALAQAGLLPVRDVMLSAAFSGEASHVKSAWTALADMVAPDDRQEFLDTALSLCVYQQELEDGNTNVVETAKAEYLIAAGANVRAGNIWQQVIDHDDAEADLYAAFLRAGADFAAFEEMVENVDCAERFITDVLKGVKGAPVYSYIDDNTLKQVTFLVPLDYRHRIETLYRFDLGRIIETAQSNGKNTFSHAMHFRDVPAETLVILHEKLCVLGGDPVPLTDALGGAVRAVIAKPVSKPAPR